MFPPCGGRNVSTVGRGCLEERLGGSGVVLECLNVSSGKCCLEFNVRTTHASGVWIHGRDIAADTVTSRVLVCDARKRVVSGGKGQKRPTHFYIFVLLSLNLLRCCCLYSNLLLAWCALFVKTDQAPGTLFHRKFRPDPICPVWRAESLPLGAFWNRKRIGRIVSGCCGATLVTKSSRFFQHHFLPTLTKLK